MRNLRRHRILAASVLSLLCVSSVRGGNITWDVAPGAVGAGDSIIAGGAGGWDNVAGNWTTDAGATNVAWDNVANSADIAAFEGTGGIVTLANAINLGGLNFSTAGYSILAQTLAFGSAQGVISTTALGTGSNVTTLGSAFTGTGGLMIASNGNLSATGGSSTGRLELSGDNSGLSGGIEIMSGLVRFTSSAAAGSAATTAGSGNTLTLSNGGGIYNSSALTLGNNIVLSTGGGGTLRSTSGQMLTLNGVISGSGGFNKTDSGTVLLANNANTFQGPVAVQGGTLRLGNPTATSTFSFTGSALSVAAGATLSMAGSSSSTITHNYNFPNLTAPISLSGGTVAFSSNNGTTKAFNGALDFSGTNTISYSSSSFTHTLNLNRAITGSGTLNVTWSGGAANRTVNFASGQTNNYTGSLVLGSASGTVAMNMNSPLGSPDLTINDADWTVTLSNTTHTFKSLSGSVGGSLRAAGASTVLDVGSGNTNTSFSGTLVNGAGMLSVVKSGSGTLTLTGDNTYSGATTVSSGTLLVNNVAGSGVGSGPLEVTVGATLGGAGFIVPAGTNGMEVSGTIAPGAGVGTLTVNLGDTTGTVLFDGSTFNFELGTPGANINAIGASDLWAVTGASANDVTFAGVTIDFGGTGGEGWYRIFDTDLDTTTWSGLTLDGQNRITSGLSAINLAPGFSVEFYMGDGTTGTNGDIYLAVIPEPSAAISLVSGLGLLIGSRRRRKS